MLVRFLALFFAFGAIVSNAAAVESNAAVELPDPADTFDNQSSASVADSARNTTVTKGGFCGSHLSDEEFNRAESGFKELLDSGKTLFPVDNSTDSSRVAFVNVYWHVVYTKYGKGVISTNLIRRNIDALNFWYRTIGVQFRLVRIDYTYSPRWFDYASIEYFNDWTNLGRFTRRGGARDLNLWSTGLTYSGYIGYARFPYEYSGTPWNDGALIRYDQLESGKLVVHEVGHWVGLFHTFQGGCSLTNDGVADTPAEASPTSGCPTYRDSCTGPSFPGLDPIHNHMDYSSENCRYEFTRGQALRARNQCRIYRGLYF
jgi:hypothetical protein